ncbi:TRAP transporter small permease [Tessaracoccus oleiagri]|uniref:TRAP-type C4-dicarboxylate transport system, small permease component n=1 Tax=Tessaracoccus oleiagri TaxID=686624 RepID=A0A1G9HCN0_9ACTN|nr:TRAP transporter small permease [Tessaracoccus oleiagri]SDL10622.1 TRAP-type C4-dicarboxylate transport system, small permease component [Tessaracoccus oleiagri]
MEKAVKAMASALGVLATLATLVMMVAIVVDVVFRTLYDRSVPGVLEISETALVVAVFLGLAYTGATNSHIAVDLLTERLPERIRRWVIFTAWSLTALVLVWLTWSTALRAIGATEENELRMGLVNWPIWPSRWVIVVGLAAMLVVAIVNMARTFAGKEVLGVDHQMPDVTVHPFEYTKEHPPVGDEPRRGHTNEEGER